MTASVLRSAGISILSNLDISFEINDSFVYIKEALPTEIVKILNKQPGAILWERVARQELWAQDQQEIVGKFFAGIQDPITIPLMARARSTNSRQDIEFTRSAYLQWRLPGNEMAPEYSTKPTPVLQPNPQPNNGGYDPNPPAYEAFHAGQPSTQLLNAPRAQLPRPGTIRNWLSRGRTQGQDTNSSDKPYG